jgi:hypothetical protein
MGYDSYEQVNTPVYDAFEVWDSTADALVPGKTEAYFKTAPNSVVLLNPSGVDVSATVPVTITELGEGTYLTKFTPNEVGEWLLIVTDDTYFDWGKRRQYLVETFLRCASSVGPYNEPFQVLDNDSNLVSGLVKADFGIKLYKQDGTEVSASVPVSILEEPNAPGNYVAQYTRNAEGKWFLVITHATHAKYGVRDDTRYHPPGLVEVQAPQINTATDDETGNSITLDITANYSTNIIHVRYRIQNAGAWVNFGTTRIGSGTLQVTGLAAHPYEFQALEQSSLTGDYSQPSNTATATVTDGSGGTDPTGPVSRPLALARQLLSQSATFQGLVGVAVPSAALAKIHIHNVDADFAAVNHAVVSHDDSNKDSIASGGAFSFNDSGTAVLKIQLEIPESLRASDKEEEAGTWFANQLGAIVREMSLISGSPSELDVHTFTVGDLERTHQEDETEGRYNYRGPISLGWGF